MFKKLISLGFLFMVVLTGCSYNSIVRNNNSINVVNKQHSSNDEKSIPFKYAFTGFVYVNDPIKDLPSGTVIFNTQKQWEGFVNKTFPYSDIPLPMYSDGIDFTKYSLIYYSIVDAKVDFYAKAWQIDKITVKNQKLYVAVKDLDDNLIITANNSDKKGGHRYVILAAIEKKYLMNIK